MIHEALILYIDDISEIESAWLVQTNKADNNHGVQLDLKDGSKHLLIIAD